MKRIMTLLSFQRRDSGLQGAKPARRKWDQPAAPPAAAAAAPAAAAVAQSAHMPDHSTSQSMHSDQPQFSQSQAYPLQSGPFQGAFGHQAYQDPSQQQPGYQQPYQHPQGMPDASMGLQSSPWQQPPGPLQQPWGPHGPAPGFGDSEFAPYSAQQHQYPQTMGNVNFQMAHSDAMMSGQQPSYMQGMHPQQMVHPGMQQYGMQQPGLQQPAGGQWYPPPGMGGVAPHANSGPAFQSMPMQPPAGTLMN